MDVVIDGIEYRPVAPTLPQELSLGDFLKETRKALGVSLDFGAVEIGCSKSYLWELEKGRSEPSLRLATRIAEVYGIRLEEMARHLTPNGPHEGPGGFSPGPLDAVVGPQHKETKHERLDWS